MQLIFKNADLSNTTKPFFLDKILMGEFVLAAGDEERSGGESGRQQQQKAGIETGSTG
jgi:hypothetical protein